MKTRSGEEESEQRKGAWGGGGGGDESHDPRYDIVLMLPQPVVIEM